MKATHEHMIMERCLRLARKGAANVSPNPMVGCVIVRNGKIVGEGFHEKFGEPHAEIIAMEHAGNKTKGAALFVSLVEKFDVAVTLGNGPEVVNGRSIMGILMLAAVEGTVLKVTVEGDQAPEAMAEFEKFFKKQEEELPS